MIEKTWEDVERESFYDPFFYAAVTRVRRGDWTREQALVALAFAQLEHRARMTAERLEEMKNRPFSPPPTA